jgi:novel protein kinase C epsilon type
MKYDTPYLGPKIQLMLSQLEFKLSVEKQYKAGIEKMVRLYQDEGDRKSRADAEGRRIESNQKIQLLKQALKRYEDLHVDIETTDTAPDGMTFFFFLLLLGCCSILTLRRRKLEHTQPAQTINWSLDHANSGRQRRRSCCDVEILQGA